MTDCADFFAGLLTLDKWHHPQSNRNEYFKKIIHKQQGKSLKQIVRICESSRNTVRKYAAFLSLYADLKNINLHLERVIGDLLLY